MRHRPVFRTEADLCAAAIDRLESWGWTVYPESCGYDFLAVRNGFSVGVQAKKAANLRLVAQALEPLALRRKLPDCIVTLVVTSNPDAASLCRALGVVHLGWFPDFARHSTDSGFWSRTLIGRQWLRNRYPELVGRIRIPELQIRVPAGVPSPQTATDWKVRAVRMCLRLRAGATITRADLDSSRLAYSTFWGRGWIERANTGRPATYRLGSAPREPHPDTAYPEIVAAIAAADKSG